MPGTQDRVLSPPSSPCSAFSMKSYCGWENNTISLPLNYSEESFLQITILSGLRVLGKENGEDLGWGWDLEFGTFYNCTRALLSIKKETS